MSVSPSLLDVPNNILTNAWRQARNANLFTRLDYEFLAPRSGFCENARFAFVYVGDFLSQGAPASTCRGAWDTRVAQECLPGQLASWPGKHSESRDSGGLTGLGSQGGIVESAIVGALIGS